VTLNPNNVWAGSAFEYLKGPAIVNIGIISQTTQALKGLLTACYIGAALIAEEFEVPNQDPAIFGENTPQLANNFYIQGGGMGGDRLVNTLRNPTAGAIVYYALALITPVGGGRRR
jgi:phage shock protein PspC (stress-responsive transcriptional regulator)